LPRGRRLLDIDIFTDKKGRRKKAKEEEEEETFQGLSCLVYAIPAKNIETRKKQHDETTTKRSVGGGNGKKEGFTWSRW